MQQVNHKKWIHIKAWETGHEGVLGPISISNMEGGVSMGWPTLTATRDPPSRSLSTRDPDTLKPLKIASLALLMMRNSLGVGRLVATRLCLSITLPRSRTSASWTRQRGQGHLPRFLMVAIRTLFADIRGRWPE